MNHTRPYKTIYAHKGLLISPSIWSEIMRMHIGLLICHFLLSTLSITKSTKNKMMGKSGLYGLYPCWGSPVKQFLGAKAPLGLAHVTVTVTVTVTVSETKKVEK